MTKDARTRFDIPVAEGEEPWTQDEIDEVHEELLFEIGRMERAIKTAEATMASLFDEGTEGAGRDPADVGSTNFERDQEMSLVQNAKDMLDQAQSALHRFETGRYGVCESCGEPIGKDRLQVFPRATMCLPCKQREERR
ncbi:TraR/DksA family transcriptional regulator [Propioniciclava tarda]|uniref:TraR/DksA family transcriptional regulator n=1 Tax=Propioniciclava tarda TaxID=433330 RepID=A0A4Q9KKA4_PROTD|nr:TraR/DksA C4-type zinc finger protein [Propioniciclava tarda]TBT94764.1 TraR/DksA family transcriptional regulator [Propioniciclava tarda]SMO64381.1 transcriptional regulator, TraR/DksA family [Propioniciclava tarda]HOA88210.1 TraR/DksA C4-type zinc finger protein [Propioniciclava tarda]HQA30561.1 TraR/DksA C4-type zinc finger protein [Propioniciclava tarda]HQD60030.1 TraR/DksA C4-type zinc finger protein [Propioniciclava tarda]